MYEEYRRWRTSPVRDEKGIVVATDQTQEWLLPWWWENYRKHNDYPVAFVNFGMSFEKKAWCKERGELIPLFVADIFVKEKEEIDPSICADWEKEFGTKFWPCRNAWFKKPLACLQSPFKHSIWIDLDCEIRASLAGLFERIRTVSLVKERSGPPAIYNSGVILFNHGHPLIEEWADQSFEKNQSFAGDQDILSHIIAEKKYPVDELPACYNWSRYHEDHPDVVIHHWHGEFGRSVIRHQIH